MKPPLIAVMGFAGDETAILRKQRKIQQLEHRVPGIKKQITQRSMLTNVV